MGEWGNETRTYKFYHKEDGPPVGFYDYTFHWTVDLSQLRGDHGVHDYSTRLYIQWNYTRLIPGVTRIELASAVLETVALPLCYTPK